MQKAATKFPKRKTGKIRWCTWCSSPALIHVYKYGACAAHKSILAGFQRGIAEARDRKEYGVTNMECENAADGNCEGEVTLAPHPFDSEVEGDYTEVYLCEACRNRAADEV